MSDTTNPIVVTEAAFSTNFKLYAPDGTQLQFTCRAGRTHAEHLTELAAYRASLTDQGYTVDAPTLGAEDGEKLEEVAAYVRGTTKAGQALVWLYSAKEVLKWRLATVYEEHLAELPFAIEGPIWPGNAAPEREEAGNKGFLQAVPAIKVVLAENGQTDDGKPRWKYARVAGAAAPAAPAAAPAPTPANGNGHAAAAAPAAPTNGNGHAAPAHGNGAAAACPKCGGPMWDNRAGKKNPAAPDFKCKAAGCDGVIWPPKNGSGNGAKAPAAVAANESNVPF